MANAVVQAGDNGVSGTGRATSGGSAALRKSVAQTQKGFGSAVSASNVFSVTDNLRFAYSNGQDADAPVTSRA